MDNLVEDMKKFLADLAIDVKKDKETGKSRLTGKTQGTTGRVGEGEEKGEAGRRKKSRLSICQRIPERGEYPAGGGE